MEQIENRPDKNRKFPIITNYRTDEVHYLSAREKEVCDTWIETMNYAICAKRVKEKYGGHLSPQAIRMWMEKREHLRMYLIEQLVCLAKYKNLTEAKWGAELVDIAMGKKESDKSQLFALKLIGEAKGWSRPNVQQIGIGTTINIKQADGQD